MARLQLITKTVKEGILNGATISEPEGLTTGTRRPNKKANKN